MDAKLKRKRIWWTLAACVLVAIGVVAAVKPENCIRALIHHRPIQYDQPFGPAISGANRIIVRADGFDCCGPIDETNILFVVTNSEEIADVANHIRFESRTTTNSLMETCMCCGAPGIDWYEGNKRIALTAVQHGHALRWRGFSTIRILGFRAGYGDGPLTQDSQTWLKDWLMSHGVGIQRDEECSP